MKDSDVVRYMGHFGSTDLLRVQIGWAGEEEEEKLLQMLCQIEENINYQLRLPPYQDRPDMPNWDEIFRPGVRKLNRITS